MNAPTRLLLCAALLFSGLALAQVQVQIQVPVPTVRFEVRPPLVQVSTGIQVVQDSDEEVFFVGGAYWCRRDGRWYRARNDRHWAWRPVERRHVPPGLMRIPPGRYRHFHGHPVRPIPAGFHDHDHWDKHSDKHWEKHDHDRHDDHGHGHGHH
jgi:hypothetical protein